MNIGKNKTKNLKATQKSKNKLEAQWAEPMFAHLSFCFEET
jgi:hypothetical protein